MVLKVFFSIFQYSLKRRGVTCFSLALREGKKGKGVQKGVGFW